MDPLMAEIERLTGKPADPRVWFKAADVLETLNRMGLRDAGAVAEAARLAVQAGPNAPPLPNEPPTAPSAPKERVKRPRLTPKECDSAKQFADYVGRLEDPGAGVQREMLWGCSEPLTTRQARAVLTSRALAYMGLDELKAKAIPIVGHTAQVMPTRKMPGGWREVRLRVTRPKGRPVSLTRRVPELLLLSPEAYKSVRPGEVHFLEAPSKGGDMRISIPVLPHSVLDVIRWWARMRSVGHPWRMASLGAGASLVWYLLTGETPEIEPIIAEREWADTPGEVVTITALPFVSARSVGAAAGRRWGRPEAQRTPAMVAFVDQRGGLNAPLKSVWREWNAANRTWEYGTPSELWTAYTRAKARG
jgi:hypothetical protein